MRTTLWGIAALAATGGLAAACGGSSNGPGATTPAAMAGACGRAHPGVGAAPLAITRAGATVALAKYEGKTLAYVADDDDQAVHVVDVDGKELGALPVGGHPSQLLLLPDGRLVVALRDTSQLVVLEPTADLAKAPLEQRCAVETEAEPVGLALTPDDAKLIVTHGSGRSLTARDAKSPHLAVSFMVALPREPRSVVVSDDGTKAFVTHAVGGRASVVDLGLQHVDAIPLHAGGDILRGNVGPDADGNHQNACQGFALAKTERPGRVLVPQVLVDTGDTTQQPSGYGSNENEQPELSDVAVLDGATGAVLKASLAGQDNTLVRNVAPQDDLAAAHPDCLLPRSAAYDSASHSLLVGCFGIDAVVAYDAARREPGARREAPLGGGLRSERHRRGSGAPPRGRVVAVRAIRRDHPARRRRRRGRAGEGQGAGADRARLDAARPGGERRARPHPLPRERRRPHLQGRPGVRELPPRWARRRPHLGDPERPAPLHRPCRPYRLHGALLLERHREHAPQITSRSPSIA